jgi:hypothetical protein
MVLKWWSRDSAVGIATGYGLDGQGSKFESRLAQDFSPLHVLQTGSGAHLAYYRMGNVGSFSPAVKRPGRKAEHSPPASTEIKNTCIYTSTPPYVFMA